MCERRGRARDRRKAKFQSALLVVAICISLAAVATLPATLLVGDALGAIGYAMLGATLVASLALLYAIRTQNLALHLPALIVSVPQNIQLLQFERSKTLQIADFIHHRLSLLYFKHMRTSAYRQRDRKIGANCLTIADANESDRSQFGALDARDEQHKLCHSYFTRRLHNAQPYRSPSRLFEARSARRLV